MAIDIQAIATEEGQKPLRMIFNGNGTDDISYLDALRAKSLPEVQRIADELLNNYRLVSQVNQKGSRTAIEKCRRAATLNKYPWFNLSHIRDYLRFRTLLNEASDFEEVIRYFDHLQSQQRISIVKIDFDKLFRPGAFGWRMIAIDIRIPSTDMLVEHYMTFRDMIEVNEAWLHKVYEAWRSASPDDLTLEDARVFRRDARFSRHAYQELLFDGILSGQRTSPLAAQRKDTGDAILHELKYRLNLR